MGEIKGALFDMDGTLLDTETLARGAFLDASKKRGTPDDAAEALLLSLVGVSSRDAEALLRAGLPEGTDLSSFDADWTDGMKRRVAEGIPIKAEVRETLEALHARGLPMAVVTSSRKATAEVNLGATGLLPFFQAIIGGDCVEANKPAPEPYQAGARALGLEPAHCAAFEDSDVGTHSAVAAGCVTVQIPDIRPAGQPFPELGQYVARTLGEGARTLGLL